VLVAKGTNLRYTTKWSANQTAKELPMPMRPLQQAFNTWIRFRTSTKWRPTNHRQSTKLSNWSTIRSARLFVSFLQQLVEIS
jgi:hypothetical protein